MTLADDVLHTWQEPLRELVRVSRDAKVEAGILLGAGGAASKPGYGTFGDSRSLSWAARERLRLDGARPVGFVHTHIFTRDTFVQELREEGYEGPLPDDSVARIGDVFSLEDLESAERAELEFEGVLNLGTGTLLCAPRPRPSKTLAEALSLMGGQATTTRIRLILHRLEAWKREAQVSECRALLEP